jgi:hypothetical protein
MNGSQLDADFLPTQTKTLSVTEIYSHTNERFTVPDDCELCVLKLFVSDVARVEVVAAVNYLSSSMGLICFVVETS